jgi:Mg-chelatase subunit ChlD
MFYKGQTSNDYLSKFSNKLEFLQDQPIIHNTQIEIETEAPSNMQDLISLSLTSNYTKIKRSSSAQKIPLMATIKTKDVKIQDKRLGLDLILIVDVSSSMMGNKIELVQETLSFILGELTPQDRVSIVKFNQESQILTPLMPMTPENIQKAKGMVYSRLSCFGSTDIIKGLKDGFDLILNRREVNHLTSIFFLSDGEDTNGNSMKSFQDLIDSQDLRCKAKGMDFNINCFGYGRDHDEKVLGMFAAKKQGNFYYIKDLKSIDECFIDCFGKLISTFAINAEINLFLNGNIKFFKKYGPCWSQENMLGKGRINIKTIAAGFETHYLAEIEVPAISEDEEVLKVAVAILTYDAKGQGTSLSNELKLTIVNDNNLGPVNSQVEEEAIRLRLADLTVQVENKVQSKNFLDAQKLVNDFKGLVVENKNITPVFAEKALGWVSQDMQDPKYSQQLKFGMINRQAAPIFGSMYQFNSCQNDMLQRKRK